MFDPRLAHITLDRRHQLLGRLLATLYTKGCYLAPHNDYDGTRAIAYVLGLSPRPWSAAQGGHLEFLSADGRRVLERRAPGWNTLDLFDVHRAPPLHRVPLVTEHVERRTLTGWFRVPG